MTNKESLPNFKGKCLSIRMIDNDFSHDLIEPSFEYQGGRLFVKGIIPDGASDSGWSNNQLSVIAWDLVRNYIVFDSLESYQAAVKISDEHDEKFNNEKEN